MKKHSKLISIVSILAMTSSLIVGCGKTTTTTKNNDDKKIRIGVVLKAVNSDYWKQVAAGAEDAGKALGVEVKVLGPNAETDIAGQTSIMEDEITKKVSALLIAPSQPSAAISIFDKADAAGIPVILADTDAKWDKKKSFVGTGNEVGGKLAGEFMTTMLKAGDEVVIIRGALGDATHDERTKGAKDALEAKGIKVIAVQPADSDMNKAMSVMENLIQVHPNIKGVFSSGDQMALGAERALQNSGKKNVVVVGFDGSPDALTSILKGELTASVAQSAYNIGKMGVEAAVKAAKGETIEKRIDTGTNLINKDNAKQAQDDLKKLLGK